MIRRVAEVTWPQLSIYVSFSSTVKIDVFAQIGLRKLDGSPKPAMEVWDGLRE
jgi:hypothetical protein